MSLPVKKASLAACQGNGAQAEGAGVGHAKGWRLAAEAMGVPWMDQYGTTQAVPPVMTEWLGAILRRNLQCQNSQRSLE